jgi:hypothetical protein
MTGQAKGIGDETQYMTQEQLEAAAAAASLDQAHAGLTQRFTAEKTAVDALRTAYEQAAAAGARFATLNPGMMKPGTQATKYAKGGIVKVGGRGNKDTEPALLTPGEAVIPAPMVKQYAPLIEGMIAGNIPGYAKGVMLGMPKSAKSVSKSRDAAEEIYQMFLKSKYANKAPTEYGHQISPTSGHSFPIFGLGGVYQKGRKQVFVKPVIDEKAALAEMRSNEISRYVHGLEAPEQRIVVIRDPMDTTRTRRFLALESDLDPKFINNQPMGLFNEEQYFRQLVASLLRADKDLSGSNVFGNVVADAGPAGVFNRASGLRDYEKNLPSMEDQALINLLGIKGGAKRAFAESTLGLMAGLTPQQYKARMLAEIKQAIPRLHQTVAAFKLKNPTEIAAYDDMKKRLDAGLGVDWAKFHSIHSAVKVPKDRLHQSQLFSRLGPKGAKITPYDAGRNSRPFANDWGGDDFYNDDFYDASAHYKDGVVSVPGPKGAGDVVPAMLSPGEAVIPAEMAKKYGSLIQGMVAGNIPGYEVGTASVGGRGSVAFNGQSYDTRGGSESRIANLINQMIEYGSSVKDVTEMLDGLKNSGDLTIKSLEQTAKANDKITTVNPNKSEAIVSAHLQGTSKILPSGERETGSFVRRMTQSQNKLLDEGGQFADDFVADWNKVEDPLIATVKLGGQEITDGIRKATDQIDDDIRDIAVAMANGQKITDDILEKAANEALSRAKARGGDSRLAAEALERTKDMKVIKPATIGSLLDSEALKPLREAGIVLGNETADQLARKLKDLGWVTPGTGNARGDLLATEKGAALTSRGVGGRAFRMASSGKYVAPERYAGEGMDKTYFNLDTSMSKLVGSIKDEVGTGIDKASAAASPSVKIVKATNNMVDGVEQAIVSSKDDVARATEEMLSPITQKRTGPRRASTDPAVMAALAGNQAAVEVSRQPRRASAPQGPPTPLRPGEPGFTGPLPQEPRVASMFMDNLSKASLALSSVTGILYMFGNDLGGIIPIISGASAAIFGLISISQALQGTFIATAAANRVAFVAQSMSVKSLSELFVKGKGLAGLFANLMTGLKVVVKFLGVAGLVISALAIAIPFVINLYQQQKDKMEAFGKIVDVTADQIKFLGQQAGESVTTTSGFDRATLGQAETATDAANERAADEQFLEKFKQQIDFTKKGALSSVNEALEVLSFKLSSAGLSDQVVNSTIAGIIKASGRTDLEFDFNKVGLSPSNTAGLLTDLRSRIATATELQQTEGYQAAFNRSAPPQSTQELKDVGTNVAALMEGLATQLEGRIITIEEYSAAFNDLRLSLVGLEGTAKETAIGEAINKIFPEDKEMANAIKGIDDLEQQMLLLELAGVGGSDSMQEFVDKTKDGTTSKAQYVAQIKKEIAAQKQVNDLKELELVSEDQVSEADALRDKIAVYDELVAAGLTAAEAYRIAGDAALTEGYKTALAAGDLQLWIDGVNEIAALTAQFESRRPTGGGGGQKSPFQEAIDSLKEQQKEAKNSIMAYAKLRSAGLGVAEASEIAGDSMLAAALASQQVGSRKWNELVTAIRAARAEEEAWLSSTPEGRAEQFAEVYSKVMDVFSAQEAVLEMNNEAATAANRKIIETLEKQIDAYQRRSSELERDLDAIAEKEDEINKAYDEKAKALEAVKKLNQDIINQQKSQLSIADALSRGDISAAASAMQDARAQSAASQGDAMGNALDAARQSQLEAITQNGKTRAQIEAEIRQIKKDIATIEFGALQNARDAVEAADEALETAKENLTVQGLSRDEWENINTNIEASKANAALYEAEVLTALENAKGLVGEWSKLQDTFTTTHVINTVNTSSNGSGTTPITTPGRPLNSRPFVPTSGILTGGPMAFVAKGGYIKPSYMAAGGMAQFARGTDTVPAMLTPGEYVVNKASTKRFAPLLEAINTESSRYSIPAGPEAPNEFLNRVYNMPERKFAPNEFFQPVYTMPETNLAPKEFLQPVYNIPAASYSPVGGAMPLNNKASSEPSSTSQDNSVYNYSLSVNVEGTSASANDIANVVMNKIKTIDSQQVRRQVLR